jgi:hypothetical protein
MKRWRKNEHSHLDNANHYSNLAVGWASVAFVAVIASIVLRLAS